MQEIDFLKKLKENIQIYLYSHESLIQEPLSLFVLKVVPCSC
jgi:hypothetical protein